MKARVFAKCPYNCFEVKYHAPLFSEHDQFGNNNRGYLYFAIATKRAVKRGAGIGTKQLGSAQVPNKGVSIRYKM